MRIYFGRWVGQVTNRCKVEVFQGFNSVRHNSATRRAWSVVASDSSLRKVLEWVDENRRNSTKLAMSRNRNKIDAHLLALDKQEVVHAAFILFKSILRVIVCILYNIGRSFKNSKWHISANFQIAKNTNYTFCRGFNFGIYTEISTKMASLLYLYLQHSQSARCFVHQYSFAGCQVKWRIQG